jgi:hypothetical protein
VWLLTLRDSAGAVVRTWSPSASSPTGRISGVSFDGRSEAGAALPAGSYRWTLTGTGPQGAPVGLFARGSASGTVTVLKQQRAAASISAPSSVRKGSYATVGGRLTAYGTTRGVASQPVTLWRRYGATGTWAKVADGRTSSTGAVTWKVRVDRAAYYQVRHPSTPQWSACSSAVRPIATS